MSAASKSFAYGPHNVTIETGELARQADAAVRVSMGDTIVLVTVCAQQTAKPGLSMTLSARPEADIQVLVAARYLPTLGASLTMSEWRPMSG